MSVDGLNISECRWLKHILRTQYFSQIIQAATHVTNSSKTLLDIIATNYPQNISLSGVVSANMSDHELVYCVRKLNWRKSPEQIKVVRNYAKYDATKFCEDLENAMHMNPQDAISSSVNDQWAWFKSLFIESANKHVPLITKKTRTSHPCPWLTSEVMNLKKQGKQTLQKTG